MSVKIWSDKRGKIKLVDHQILILLIRGLSPAEVADVIGLTKYSVSQRIARMKKLLECRTLYQLVALETVNLLEDPSMDVDGMLRAGVGTNSISQKMSVI